MFRRRALLHVPGTSVIERSRTIALHKNWLVVATIALVASGGPLSPKTRSIQPRLNPRTAVSGQGGQSNVQDRIRWTVDWYTLFGYRPLSLRMPCLPRPDGMGSSYAPSAKGFAQDDELTRISSEWSPAVARMSARRSRMSCRHSRHPNVACYLDDLYAICVPAPMTRRAGAARETRRQASRRPAGGGFLHGQAMIIRNVRRWPECG